MGGNPIPADIKPFANKHPEMTAKVCALVEFERTEFALKAVRELNDMAPKEEPKAESSEEGENKDEEKAPKANMVVMELTAPPPKTTKNKEDKNKAKYSVSAGPSSNRSQPSYSVGQALTPTRRFSYAGHGQQQQQLHQQHGRENNNLTSPGNGQRSSPGNDDLGPRRRISLYHNMKFTPIAEEASPPPPGRKNSQHQREMGLNPNAPTFTMQQQQQQQQYNQRSGRYSRHGSQAGHFGPSSHHQPHPADIMMASGPHPMPTQNAAAHAAQVAHNAAMAAHAAFQQHSAVAAQAAIVAATGMAAGPVPFVHRRISQEHVAASGLALPPNVIRLPRGPDKNTKGFQRWCKSRMVQNHQSPASVEEQKPKFGMHKRGSHAVPIVAPPKEERSKATQKKAEEAKESKIEPVEKKVEMPEKEEIKEVPEPSSSISGSVSVESSVQPAEEGASGQAQNPQVVNVPVVQGRIIIAADSDTCSDSGNDSEPDQEAAADRAEARPQPGPSSFADSISMDNDNERSR